MDVSLRWYEEPFECEFVGAQPEGTLRMRADGQVVWSEPVRSAALAYGRAREVKDQLLAPRRARRA